MQRASSPILRPSFLTAAAFALALPALACSTEIDKAPAAQVADVERGGAAEAQPASTDEALDTLQLVVDQSSVAFVGAKVTGSHRGQFGAPTGSLKITKAGQVKAMDIEIATTSLDIEPEKLEQHLRSPDFFDVEAHPKATFNLVELRDGASGQPSEIVGDLQIRGKTKRVTFPATIRIEKDRVEGDASFKIDRRDFDITYAGMADDLIKNDVLLEMKLRFARA